VLGFFPLVCLSFSVRPSISLEQLGFYWREVFHYMRHLNIIGKSVDKFQVTLKSDKNNGYFTLRPMYISDRGTRWRSWLRNCATSRKVASSIPDFVIGNFSLKLSFRPHYGPGIDSASNRNEYQEYFLGAKCGRCLGLTIVPPSCADCVEIWEPQPPGILRACPDL